MAASSVIVLQKPSAFLKGIIDGGIQSSHPIIILFLSVVLTLYVTISIHRYLYILIAGVIQLCSMFYYVSSFVPGGQKGLELLLRTSFIVVKTVSMPFIFVVRKSATALIKQIFS